MSQTLRTIFVSSSISSSNLLAASRRPGRPVVLRFPSNTVAPGEPQYCGEMGSTFLSNTDARGEPQYCREKDQVVNASITGLYMPVLIAADVSGSLPARAAAISMATFNT